MKVIESLEKSIRTTTKLLVLIFVSQSMISCNTLKKKKIPTQIQTEEKIKYIDEMVAEAHEVQKNVNNSILESTDKIKNNEEEIQEIVSEVEKSNTHVLPRLEQVKPLTVKLKKEIEVQQEVSQEKEEEIEELQEEIEELQDSSFLEIKKKLAYCIMVGTFLLAISLSLIVTGNPRCIYIGVLGFGLIISASVSLYFLSNIAWIAPIVICVFVIFTIMAYYYNYIHNRGMFQRELELDRGLEETVMTVDELKKHISDNNKKQLFSNNGPISEIQNLKTRELVAKKRNKI